MNGGLVPLLLLSAAIGLMLAFVPVRSAGLALAAYAAAALLGLAVSLGLSPGLVFTGVWLSAIAAAVLVYVPAARWSFALFPLSLNAGFWLGASAALAENRAALMIGLLPALVAIPAKWLTQRKFDIVIKVVASWMIAIASLSLFVSLISTPGYKPDHMQ